MYSFFHTTGMYLGRFNALTLIPVLIMLAWALRRRASDRVGALLAVSGCSWILMATLYGGLVAYAQWGATGLWIGSAFFGAPFFLMGAVAYLNNGDLGDALFLIASFAFGVALVLAPVWLAKWWAAGAA